MLHLYLLRGSFPRGSKIMMLGPGGSAPKPDVAFPSTEPLRESGPTSVPSGAPEPAGFELRFWSSAAFVAGFMAQHTTPTELHFGNYEERVDLVP